MRVGKIWAVQLLSYLRKLWIFDKAMVWLDCECQAKLKEIALETVLVRPDHPVDEDRRVHTLDEARFAGSPEAWLLFRHELHWREYERLNRITQLARQETESRRQRELLSGKTA